MFSSLRILLLITLLVPVPALRAGGAGEGMWIPLLLGLNEADMQAKGLQLSAEDIYSVNQGSLKDAIVRFGGGCTGEIISPEGLLLTNHHCGYGQIRNQSTLAQNYLRDGFWAMSREEELPNPGLTATFVVRIEDVTEAVLAGLPADADEATRAAHVRRNSLQLEGTAVEGTHYEAEVRPFYDGNEYYLIVTEVFEDVRLVGAPPEAIGKFGGETDNWLWPRHNADFALFRVYSGPDGKPAPFAEGNIPLKPRHFLPISLDGVAEDDFTMVFGFPGQTQEYLPAAGVRMIQEVEDPIRVQLRGERLAIMNQYMRADEGVRLMYASKAAGVGNGYTKWKGRILGLKATGAVARKEARDAAFTARIAADPALQARYGNLLAEMEQTYAALVEPLTAVTYFIEGGYSLEWVPFVARAARMAGNWQGADAETQAALQDELAKYAQNFFKGYHPPIDQDITAAMLRAYAESLPADMQPEVVRMLVQDYQGDFEAFAEAFFARSAFVDSSRFAALMADFSPDKVQQDPGYALMYGLYGYYFDYQPVYDSLDTRLQALQRTYMQAQREAFPEQTFYPDANSTLRLTYGKAEGMQAHDAVRYRYYTTLDGVVAKYIPGDYEFDLPQRLLDLHAAGDYGRYAHPGTGELRVAFIASNHTSGGNSGSPVLNGRGELIGINFDRNWEGTMSDVNYDQRLCRNISVDIRYILFLIDTYAGAGHLIEEMKLVSTR